MGEGRVVIRSDLRGWGSTHEYGLKRNGVRDSAHSVSFRWTPASSTGVHLEALGGNSMLPPLGRRPGPLEGLVEGRPALVDADASEGWRPPGRQLG